MGLYIKLCARYKLVKAIGTYSCSFPVEGVTAGASGDIV